MRTVFEHPVVAWIVVAVSLPFIYPYIVVRMAGFAVWHWRDLWSYMQEEE